MEVSSQGYTEDECYRRLRDAIIDGTLMPSQRLVEMDLARWLGASRATIRTVLARLEQDGLVERERYRGARVRHVSHEEAVEILEVRMALECVIARYAALRATDEDVRRLEEILSWMRRQYEGNDLLSYSDGNAKLHRTIADISRHQTARRLLDTLNSQSVRYQYRTILAPNRSAASMEEHERIVDAIRRRDPDAAEHAMRVHLSHVCDTLRGMRQGF
ncbi:GntR family transcriptional regulator [Alicyclobacillus sendaiensis]|uniref:GntR family transcriptional regulator n=1 Tax=Alicyclobacillus sendaiensis PA2 TaxID=3029425 RepID=A0ABT6XVW2_ALISE|nr:GntR family transcriptional regulator [Alicyclobacillus sendaiensis]MDI9259220.1 GntR family transcriptional regulator [Alicyclobacillus sendaiensis PA2]